MRSNKTIFKEIVINPYVCEMWILITNNPSFESAKLNQKHKGLNLKWPEGATAWTEDYFYKDNYLTVIFDGNDGHNIGTIVHEAIHIKNQVYEHAGIKHDPKNDEPEAYLVDWICRQIDECWKEYRKL